MDYKEFLEDSFRKEKLWNSDLPFSKYHFLAESVFGLVTYDDDIDEFLVKKLVRICVDIAKNKTFEYAEESAGNYKWYIALLNLPFFKDKLNWGTSIRGAWFDADNGIFEIPACGFWDENDEQIRVLKFNKEQWLLFIDAINAFINNTGGQNGTED